MVASTPVNGQSAAFAEFVVRTIPLLERLYNAHGGNAKKAMLALKLGVHFGEREGNGNGKKKDGR